MFHFEVTDDAVPETPRTGRTGNGDSVLSEVNYNIGDKICDPEKYTGCVKYIGNVGKYAGIWLGIEWDEKSRGKHSGSVDDVEYFKCSVPNSGSFIRPAKAKKVCGIKEALTTRYGHDEAVFNSLKSIEDRLEKKKISYGQLRTLNLSSRGIEDSSSDEVQDVISLCPNIEVLELADNLIQNWSFIGRLCLGFPRLNRLDLSKNPLSEISDKQLEEYKTAFAEVNHLILGKVGYCWNAVLRLSPLWTKLTNLQVPFNSISELCPPTLVMRSITRLDLEGNKISSWTEVMKLTTLESLEYLNLCGNTIKTVRFPAETNQIDTVYSSIFPNLVVLNITENSIDDWISVSELNKLKNLRELRMDLNPLLNKDSRATNRQMIVARLGKLQKLEGAEVTRQERRDSEIDYVKKFSLQWEAEKDSFRFTAENPRYRELIEKWGESETGEVAPIKTMKSSLLSLTFVSEATKGHKPITKKVVPSMTVQKLKGLIQRVFKEENSPEKIVVVSSRNPGITFPLEDDFVDLATYSVEEGDKLMISW